MSSPDWSTAISCMGFDEVSPILTLLDWLLLHNSAIAPLPPPNEADEGAPAIVNVETSTVLHSNFLRAVSRHLSYSLHKMGLDVCFACIDGTTNVVLCHREGWPQAHALSRANALRLGHLLEKRLEERSISLDLLHPVAERAMQLCIDEITESKAIQNLDLSAIKKSRVLPGTFFNEPWSVGLETAWQASGAEGVLTMPNYAQWTSKHAEHRAKSRQLHGKQDGSDFPWGRLWRLERWSCISAPCHEVIHLVQHVALDSIGPMNLEVAEHDGAFSTCLLMLAIAHREQRMAAQSSESIFANSINRTIEGESGASKTAEPRITLFYPGAVEEALLEIAQYVGRLHFQETEEAQERWSTAERAAYARWRDGFGSDDMAPCWGSRGNFGGDLKRESLCKQVLALEAVCPAGRVLSERAEVAAAAEAMLHTMFAARAEAFWSGERLRIAPEVRLSGMAVERRIGELLEPLGAARAKEVVRELGFREVAMDKAASCLSRALAQKPVPVEHPLGDAQEGPC